MKHTVRELIPYRPVFINLARSALPGTGTAPTLANYSHIVRNNLSSPSIFFTDVPKNKIFASVQYTPISRLYLLASTEYNSNRYSTSYGTVAKGFGLTNVKINASLAKGLSLEAGANNLFDRNYQLAEGFPQAGRNFFSTLLFNY